MDEFVDVGVVGVLDGEVVDDKCEFDWFGGMAPESRCVAALVPAMFGEAFFE